MGYYEQIGKANREYRRGRAAMHPLRRKLGNAMINAVVYTISFALWVLLLSPLWPLALR
jgi:hypothetical protein